MMFYADSDSAEVFHDKTGVSEVNAWERYFAHFGNARSFNQGAQFNQVAGCLFGKTNLHWIVKADWGEPDPALFKHLLNSGNGRILILEKWMPYTPGALKDEDFANEPMRVGYLEAKIDKDEYGELCSDWQSCQITITHEDKIDFFEEYGFWGHVLNGDYDGDNIPAFAICRLEEICTVWWETFGAVLEEFANKLYFTETAKAKTKRLPISKKLRFKVLARHDRKCFYCGRGAGEVALEIDHVVPVSRGGSNDLSNLVAACRSCNIGKGAQLLTEFTDD